MKIFNVVKEQKAQSLIELLIALGVFVLVVTAINFLSLDTYVADRAGGERTQATFLAKEGIEAARSISSNNWENLILGEHGLTISDGKWVFQGTEDDFSDQLTQGQRVITIEEDAICNTNCRKITSEVTWQLTDIRPQTVTLVTYSTNLVSRNWLQTLLTDFNLGKRNSVQTTETGDGEVKLSLVGDWENASILNTFNSNGNGDIQDIFISDNIVYIATRNNSGEGEEEFIILDISDISNNNITELGAVEIGDDVRGLYVYENYAYLVTDINSQELVVIRLSDYTKVNQYDIPSNSGGLDVFVNNNIAYIGTNKSNSEEFYALDVSNPEGEITELGAVEVNDDVQRLWVSENYAYLATEHNSKELFVIRLSDYTEINSVDLSGHTDMTSIMVVGNTAYLGRKGSGEHEFYALNVSDPEGIINQLGSVNMGGDDVNAIYINGNRAYLATNNNDGEIAVIDLDTYTELTRINLTGDNTAYAVWFQGAYIYTGSSSNNNEFQIVEGGQGGWSDTELIGSYNLPGSDNANDVFVLNNYAYVVTEEDSGSAAEFFIFDISDSENPDLRSSLNLAADINSVFVSGNYAYVATDNDSQELMVINITNKDDPNKVGSFNTPGSDNANDVFVLGNYAYVVTQEDSNDDEFFIIDVSNPEDLPLEKVGSLEIGTNVSAVYVSSGYAYIATDENDAELMIIDVSNPEDLSIDGLYNADSNENATDIFINGDTAYLTTRENTSSGDDPEFYILDITTPTAPSLISYLEIETNVNSIFVSGDYAYLGTDENNNEFQMIDISTLVNPLVYNTLDINGDVQGIFFNGNYVYLATKNDSLEVQIIGPKELPDNYSQWGIFTSSIYNSGQVDTSWNNIFWTESGNGTIKFQFRTADTEENLSSAIWVGSDGTSNTYYTILSQPIITDTGATGTQWAQYRVFFTGNGIETPVLEEIIFFYSD